MKDYTVVNERSLKLLIDRVNRLRLIGWVPMGPMLPVQDCGLVELFQTMVLPFDAEGFKQPR